MDIFDLGDLYDLARKQNEGLGTAYEYRVKLKLLDRLLAKLDSRPRSLLIAGLPEKYGYGMDIVLLSHALKAKLTVTEDRSQCLKVFGSLYQSLGLPTDEMEMIEIESWKDLPSDTTYDLIVSCEVLQRLQGDSERQEYVRQLGQRGRVLAIFAPSSGNKSHAKLSGLNTVSRKELEVLVDGSGLQRVESGYLDAPPFPPGLKMKHSTTDAPGGRGLLERIAMFVLGAWSNIDRLLPSPVMQRVSHMTYVAGTPKREQ